MSNDAEVKTLRESNSATGASPVITDQNTRFDWFNGVGKNINNYGIYTDINPKTIKDYLRDPVKYLSNIISLMDYFYRAFPEISNLYDKVRDLPNLDSFGIEVLEKDSKHTENVLLIKQIMKKLKYRTLVRSLMFQLAKQGTVIGYWIGKKNPHFYMFDDLKLVFPSYVENGEWIAAIDFSELEQRGDTYVENFLNSFEKDIPDIRFSYKKYKSSRSKYNLLSLDPKKTCILKINAEMLEQFGTPLGLSATFDLLHKKHLKDLEKSVANKVIGSIFVLTVGESNKEMPQNNYLNLNPSIIKDLLSGVKTALNTNRNEDGMRVASIPNFSKLEVPDMKVEKSLEPDKYENINKDIASGVGIPSAVMTGEGGNYQSAKLGYSSFYSKLAHMLEMIEEEVFSKLLNIILPKKSEDNYSISFNKKMPLDAKDIVTTLTTLHTSEGWSLKHLLEQLGLDFKEYFDESIYEHDDLKITERIQPMANAHTSNNDNTEVGRPSVDDPENENTAKNKANKK